MPIDISQLEDDLDKLPERIRGQELAVAEKDKLFREAKLNLDVAAGMTVLTSKAPNATEKKAKATVETQEDMKNLIEAEYNLKKEEAALTYLQNKFIALRKISSIETEMIKSQLSGY